MVREIVVIVRNEPSKAIKANLETISSSFLPMGLQISYIEEKYEDLDKCSAMGITYTYKEAKESSKELERLNFTKFKALVDELLKLSSIKGYDFQISMDGRLIGRIRWGTCDKSLNEVLLIPWQKALDC